MTNALPRRITALAVLIVISFAAYAPSRSGMVDFGKMIGRHLTGIHSPDVEAAPALADQVAQAGPPVNDGGVMTTFDMQQAYANQAMGVHDPDQLIGFAPSPDDVAPQQALLDTSDGMAYSPTLGGAGGPSAAGHHAGQGASPSLGGGHSQPQASLGGGGTTGFPTPGTASAPGNGTVDAAPGRDIAQAGKDDGLDPFVYGSAPPNMRELIDVPDGIGGPTAGVNAADTTPAAGCQGAVPCDAPLPTANNTVPEPGSVALLGLGLIGLALGRRRQSSPARTTP